MDDSDEEDLWADMDEEAETTLTVSENLLTEVSAAQPVIHKGDVDEGKVTWEGPMTPGLHNSVKVSEAKSQHWFRENEDAAAAPAAPAAMPYPTMAAPGAAPGAQLPVVPMVPPAAAAMTAASPPPFPVSEPAKAPEPMAMPAFNFFGAPATPGAFGAPPPAAMPAAAAAPPAGGLLGGGFLGGGFDWGSGSLPQPGSLFG